jgi:hypothetical protein
MLAALTDDGREASVKATRREQAALVAAPETFGVPAYVGRHGWVSIQLATVDPTDVKMAISRASGCRLHGVPVLTMAWP